MADVSKADDLRRQRCYHPAADGVTDPLFRVGDFFDPRDLLLVKCELLRRVRCDGVPVLRAAGRFAIARATYYQAAQAWAAGGLLGLLPRRSGPRQGYKLTADLVASLGRADNSPAPSDPTEVAHRLWEERHLRVHPRSIERALQRGEKGGSSTTRSPGSPTGTTVTRRCVPPG